MPKITGKTIYVLGAGASHHTGAPLLRDFLVTARLLREGRNELRHQASFDNVFRWIDSLRASSYYVEFDLDNLEHVFSLADMSRQLDLEQGSERFADLKYVVMETLDRLQLRVQGNQLAPDPVYRRFLESLQRLNQQREEYTGEAHGSFQRDVVVTFNYDVMLDYAMEFMRIEPDYSMTPVSPANGFRLLKLHGSTNWAYCRECKAGPQVVPANPIPAGHMAPPLMKDGDAFVFRMVTNNLPKTACQSCGKKDMLEPIVIPPTWSKAVSGTPISSVWKMAVEEIRNAYQIVVIGYSMPSTDTFFQYLLTLGLGLNPSFHRVVVVNRDRSETLKERYERVFSRSLNDRGRLKYIIRTFQEFTEGGMMEAVGSEADWLWE